MLRLLSLFSFLALSVSQVHGLDLTCPTNGKGTPFNVTVATSITIGKTSGVGTLCTLTLELDNGLFIPIARSYDGHNWERAGGSFIASAPEWVCSGSSCTSIIPPGSRYVLQTRSTSATLDFNAELARFLESASFGAKPTDISTWNGNSFAQYVKDQVNTPMTSHRETFRKLSNPRWTFNKPEFAGRLDPCGPNSTWRRQILTTTDRRKFVNVGKYDGRWEIKIDGYVRSQVVQLRFTNAGRGQNDTVQDGGSYEFCSTEEEVRRNIFKLRINSNCRPLISSDLTIDFSPNYTPLNSVQGVIPALGESSLISSKNPEYLFKDAIIPTTAAIRSRSLLQATATTPFVCRPLFKFLTFGFFCRRKSPPTAPTPVVPASPTAPGPAPTTSPTSSCKLTSPSSAINAPIFAKTNDGIWLQHDPRIDMKKNTITEPLLDGGLSLLKNKQAYYCSNAVRTFFNEDKCVMSKVPACFPGTTNQSFAATGTILCGSSGEIGNDLTTGDNWLEISSIDSDRSAAIGLPADTTNQESLGRQREFLWSEISLKANDQLRQRIAFALLHIFSLPKLAVSGEFQLTEIFLIYYDIFVRNAFGNYGDILKEISYNALNAESLSYTDSRSVAHYFAWTKVVVFPDENYARELMQLFTIGLFQLNMDGTPVLDANGTIQSYTSDDILSFARVWTAFRRNSKRANVETISGNENRYDPLRLDADRRDRFPKTDLAMGYIGDYFPLCIDLPAKPYLSIGAKYRLLGSSPRPELKVQKWTATASTQYLNLQSGSSLYAKLCNPSQSGACAYPSVVVLDSNLGCNGLECSIDTVQVLQVGSVFYEYIRVPCVEQPFFMNGIKISGKWRDSTPICTNPLLPVASETCCLQNETRSWKKDGIPACLMTGEVMTWNTAQSHCASIGRGLCDYSSVNATDKCPLFGSYWTTESCMMRVKVSSDGQAALVHKFFTTNNTSTDLKENTPNYFKVYWKDGQYPSVASACGFGQCEVYQDTCICNVTVSDVPVFESLPTKASQILQEARIGHPGLSTLNTNTVASNGDYKYYGKTQVQLDKTTVFEVTDRSGQTKYLRNLKSTVTIAGTAFEFRNPPQFNSILSTEYSIADAHYETEAALDHLLYHPNTPPFVAYRFIQRFGVSNPSPRYTLAVANAFKTGKYEDTGSGLSFGKGKYGDMEATIAAVLLDREARSVVLDKDPAHGMLREPILKVLSFMRATDFKSSAPLVELDYMEQKVGQMAYEQASVFSFFRPEYSPSELAGTGLTAPESQTMSSTSIVGLMNGLYSLIKYGLNECNGGFGAFGDCSNLSPSGNITYIPSNINSPTDMVRDLSHLLTGGRMTAGKQQAITLEVATQPNATSQYQLALQLLTSSPEFHSTSSFDPLAPAEKPPKAPSNIVPPTNDYKVVIHLMFRGGVDSFNILVPSSSCGSFHQEYMDVRGLIGLTPAQTIPLTGGASQQPCSAFTVHSGLSTMQKLYNEQDLLFMANVGVLTQYVNRSNYDIRTETPLFSHNSMQDEVAKLDPFKSAPGTGALGRMADVLQLKGYMTARTTIDAPSSNLASNSGSTPPIFSMSARGVSLFNVAPSSSTMNNAIQQLNNGISGVYGDLWSTVLKRSINQTDQLAAILKNQTKTIFPSTALGNRFKVASQMIASRVARGVDRDVFFIPFDGFDTHSEVTKTLESRFLELNDALEDFVAELKLLGVWDNTAIVQASDFGRTMTGNSGGGTDHGWGGNYFLAGGGVKGQQIVGKYPPTFSLNYEFNIDRGRIIPTTAWDSVFNSISQWMGVSTTDLQRVLPNRNKFNDLFDSSALFNN